MPIIPVPTVLQAGDTLIVRVTHTLTEQQAEMIGQALSEELSVYGVDVMLVAAEEFAVARFPPGGPVIPSDPNPFPRFRLWRFWR